MSYEDDPSSFLFGLNQFASPPTDSQNDERSSAPESMLAGLEAFASDDLGGPAQGAEPGAQAPNFADQLALWTNANFSFDGPTGHALIGDEEKEKEEAEHNRRREEENRRNEEEDRERMARNAAASSRGGNAARGKAREIAAQNDDLGQHQHPFQQPNGHSHGPSHGPQQHQPSPSFMGQHQAKSNQGPLSGFGAPQGQRPQQLPNGNMNAQTNGGFHPFFNSLPGFNQLNSVPHQQSPPTAPANGAPHLDMTSALALQHLLTSNPLAIASLGQFVGFSNPQLQAQLASLVGGGLNLGAFGQQQGVPQSSASQASSPWEAQQQPPQQRSRQGSQSAPVGAPLSWPTQMPSLPNGSGPLTNGAAGGFGGTGSGAQDSATIPSKKKRVSTSAGKKASNGSEDFSDEELGMKQEDIDRKYEIPPLKLIDTGNPEADAEANRLAIEEDKRRRNTAASARFRIKKKQREAALEHTAKELQQRLADLESENARLRTENGWLKSLITVQPGQSSAQKPAAPEASPFGAAAGPSGTSSQADATSFRTRDSSLATQPSASSNTGTQEHPERNSGLVPRSVGTDPNQKDGAHLKRDRED